MSIEDCASYSRAWCFVGYGCGIRFVVVVAAVVVVAKSLGYRAILYPLYPLSYPIIRIVHHHHHIVLIASSITITIYDCNDPLTLFLPFLHIVLSSCFSWVLSLFSLVLVDPHTSHCIFLSLLVSLPLFFLSFSSYLSFSFYRSFCQSKLYFISRAKLKPPPFPSLSFFSSTSITSIVSYHNHTYIHTYLDVFFSIGMKV